MALEGSSSKPALADVPATTAATSEPAPIATMVIEPPRGILTPDWRELWRHRDLLYFLTWRDIKLRYKQAVFGAAWAVLQPLLTMAIFAVIFGRVAGLGAATDSVPYPLYVFAGLLPWLFFSNGVANASNSVILSANLVTKVYFPRLIIPFASVGVVLVDLAISFGVLAILFVYYHWALTWQIALLPVVLAGLILFCLGVGAVLAALNVAYRDFRFVVPFLLQVWLFVTPVIYPLAKVPERFRWLFWLNPVAGLVDGMRAALLGGPIPTASLGVSLVASAFCFLVGVGYFRAVERRFADII